MAAQNLGPLFSELDTWLCEKGGILSKIGGVYILMSDQILCFDQTWELPNIQCRITIGVFQYICEGHKPEGDILPNPNPPKYTRTSLGNEKVFTQEFKITVRLEFPIDVALPDCLGELESERQEVITVGVQKVLRRRFCATGQNRIIAFSFFEEVFTLLDSSLTRDKSLKATLLAA